MKPQSRKTFVIVLLLSFMLQMFLFTGSALASVNEQQAQFAAPKLVVNASFLNVRTGPSAQYSVLITVVGGTELPVLGVAKDRVWYQVSTVAGVGWVNVEYTLPRGDFSAVPFVESPVMTNPNPPLVIQDTAQLGQGGGGALVAPAVASSGRPWGVSVIGGDFHTGPDFESEKLSRAMGSDMGTIYPVTNFTINKGLEWFQFTIPEIGSGWMQGGNVLLRPLICPGANQSALIITKPTGIEGTGRGITPGQEAYIIGIGSGDRVRIELFGGANGWIAGDVTTGRDDSKLNQLCGGVSVTGGSTGTATSAGAGSTSFGLAAPRVVINTAFLNIRSGPGAQYTVLATLPGGTELPVVGMTSDKVWYLVQGAFGQGWLNSEFGAFRGDMGNVPIIKNAAGILASPSATVTGALTLYAAPNATLGTVGTITGPVQVAVVARTADFSWVQLNTVIGFGWVPASQVAIGGDTSLIPVVQ